MREAKGLGKKKGRGTFAQFRKVQKKVNMSDQANSSEK